ncbi:MAG: hypothetical protein A3F84_04575 [Candidatus Handelsmanbacteria bacterium RIFCSPLOWO2_12_FULL_64_10]|uniref:ISXO2-like transposase domain-containing protein n=1 Tax=Handelsmanbacteria sp. (strain RIFCSPLOWO2_12_FULL_64_10) TaxID=1817868 RepID=A0A1F6D6N6_HANXR|nr:MAG: hypothetical protein A3F84_04575 [Candidatus Handelsmanbacteria bacterium RIFCSPLOWO2_12_FULL_64_10]
MQRSRLTARQGERLLEHFVAGTPARSAAGLVGVNRNTARFFYHRLREIIARRLAQANPVECGLDTDEAFLRGAPGREQTRGTACKVPVFGLYKSDGKIHTVMMLDVLRATPSQPPKSKVRPDAIVYTDTPVIPAVLDASGFRHERMSDRMPRAQNQTHINSIENFWSQAKRHLRRYGGIPRRHFHLFLKECEWRFNYGSPKQLLKSLKSWIKACSGRA